MAKSALAEPCLTNAPVPLVTIMWVLSKVPETGLDRVRSLPPSVRLPLVSVNVPAMETELLSIRPFALFSVRLFKFAMLEGSVSPDVVPPMTREEEEVVVKLVGVVAIAGPFKVRILPATAKAPEVMVRVPLIVVLSHKVTPPLQLIVKF